MLTKRVHLLLVLADLALATAGAGILVRPFGPSGECAVPVVNPFFGRHDPQRGWQSHGGAAGPFQPKPGEPVSAVAIKGQGGRG